MKEIDAVIDQHGGCPGPFVTNPTFADFGRIDG
jgi:hypothetical protein